MALIHHLLPRPLSHLRRSYFAILPNGSSEARPPPLNPGLRGHLRGHTRLGAPLLRKENQGVTRWCECANALDVRSPVSKAPLCARLKQHTRIPNRLLKNSSCRHSEEPPRLRSGQAKATRNLSNSWFREQRDSSLRSEWQIETFLQQPAKEELLSGVMFPSYFSAASGMLALPASWPRCPQFVGSRLQPALPETKSVVDSTAVAGVTCPHSRTASFN